jgi:UDP-N-acetylglucosamine:LPS N-acetylglucosamine transferase
MSAEALAQRLGDLMDQPHTLATAAAAARRVGTPEATRKLADVVVDLVGGAIASPSSQKNEEAREALA